jgi:membrane dipeptidase
MPYIIDAHLDLAWNALQWNRNLLAPVEDIRVSEQHVPGPGRGQGTVALPEMRRGRVALCFATLLARSTGEPVPNLDYATPAQAYGIVQGQLAYYHALAQQGEIRLITGRAELDNHIAEWEQWERDEGTRPQPPLGLIISMESADPILHPSQLPEWWQDGVRVIGPAHYGPGRYAGGTGSESGLTRAGFSLLREMEQVGIILDLTHLSDRAFWQALNNYSSPVLASHNNCRALVPHPRQFDDDQLRAIIAREGVIGVACDNWMIRPGWVRGAAHNQPVSLAHVVDHIDHICQCAGNDHHVAIGSDLDGGFGREQSPHNLDTIADLPKLSDLLAVRGYSEKAIAAIFHGNWLRLLRRVWA